MAIVLTELLDGRASNDSSATSRRAFRCYDDAGGTVTESLARAQVVINGLSAGHPHPFIPGLVGRAPSYQQNGRFVDVTVDYVVPALGTTPQPPIDPTGDNFESMSTTFRIEEVQIPSFETKRVFVTDDAGETVSEAVVWERSPELPPVQKTLHVFTYRISGTFAGVGVSGWLNVSSAIRAQANKLHVFNGVPYLFEPRVLNQEKASTATASAKWRVEYNWTFDPGIDNDETRWIQTAGDNPQLKGDGARFYPVFDATYMIPPWHGVFTAPVGTDPTQSPITVFRELYLRDPNGWQTLPGIA